MDIYYDIGNFMSESAESFSFSKATWCERGKKNPSREAQRWNSLQPHYLSVRRCPGLPLGMLGGCPGIPETVFVRGVHVSQVL